MALSAHAAAKVSKRNPRRIAARVLDIEGRALIAASKRVDASFERAVARVLACTGRVIVTGIGKSGLIGRKISATLASTGTPSLFVHPVECFHGDLGMLAKNDIILALSHSGETEEICKLMPVLKKLGLGVIAITGSAKSKLARHSDITLISAIEREACPFNITPTTSTTLALAIGDALAIALMLGRGFGKEDFARLHPGGSLGKILTMKVSDFMRTGKANPVLTEKATVRKAIEVMTATRMGAVSLTGKNGRLTGFFTDGDLRRRLADTPDIAARLVCDVMTKNPLCVTPADMAADAARIITERHIDNLPVVDSKGKPVGILDEQDLLEIFPLLRKDNADA